MPSASKAAVLRRHDENALLNTSAPPLVPRSARDLSTSQPRGDVGEDAMTASVRALREGQTHYVDVPGIGPLREALAAYLRETIGANYDSSQVLVTAGVQESRFLTLQKIGEQFERVAMPAVVHPGARRALGTRPLALSEMDVDEANGYLPTLEAMRQALADGIRLLYLESPSRLTGKAYGAADVDRLADFLNEFDAGLILDQGLAPWIAGGYQSPAAAQRAPDNVAVLGEAWPGMGLTSWFIAYIATPEKWFEPMRSQKQIMAICTSTASQYAALESGRRYEKDHPAQLAQLEQNRARAADLAQAAGLVPLAGEANAVLALRCAAAEKADVLTALREARYEVADGAGFGAADVVRLAVSLDETTTTALQSLN